MMFLVLLFILHARYKVTSLCFVLDNIKYNNQINIYWASIMLQNSFIDAVYKIFKLTNIIWNNKNNDITNNLETHENGLKIGHFVRVNEKKLTTVKCLQILLF